MIEAFPGHVLLVVWRKISHLGCGGRVGADCFTLCVRRGRGRAGVIALHVTFVHVYCLCVTIIWMRSIVSSNWCRQLVCGLDC